MDWGEDMASNMWVPPRGMKRDGRGGKNTVAWESKYGSLIVSAYDIGTTEDMNEKELVVNELALVESNYGKLAHGEKTISLSTWPQYVLHNVATVPDVVADLRQEKISCANHCVGHGPPGQYALGDF
jgi:penicillin V acylase-like amidase (Ntn superfamily)